MLSQMRSELLSTTLMSQTNVCVETMKTRSRKLGVSCEPTTSRSRRMCWMWTSICAPCDLFYRVPSHIVTTRMAYIEENMKLRRGAKEETKKDDGPADPYAELFRITDRYKLNKEGKEQEEGSVTNSMAMLTAIPEVDLGME